MREVKKLQKLFLHLKPTKLILALKPGPKYATLLAKEIDCTYSHTIKLLESFRKFGLVEFEKKGRIKIIKLTDAGHEIVKGIEAILSKINKIKES